MMKQLIKALTTFVLVLIFPLFLYASAYECKVTKVVDGDTFYCKPLTNIPFPVKNQKGVIVVRLRGIDAPEKDQPYGLEAKNSLEELIGGKVVRLDIKDMDRYGRVDAYVFVGSLNVNLEQVKRGLAWAYTEYLDRPYISEFYEVEKKARSKELGLWRQANPTPPWEWRKIKRFKEKVFTNEDLEKYQPTYRSSYPEESSYLERSFYTERFSHPERSFERKESYSSGRYVCGRKYYCSQMESCEEAMFYYTVCGLKRLDGDGDGVPCENLCGERH